MLMKHIQNNQKPIEKSIPAKKSVKQKSRDFWTVWDFQKENHTLGNGFKIYRKCMA